MTDPADKSASGEKRFQEQCYLLWNWSTFHKNNQSTSYENFVILMGQPSDVINKLVAKVGVEALFTLRPYEVATLVPKIRLFKVSYANSTEGETQEIVFSDHTSAQTIENITKTRFGRGDGIGLKSFEYDLQGGAARGGPSLVKKGVTKVNLTFLFQNLEMLLQREPGQPALIDLLSHSPKDSEGEVPGCAEGTPLAVANVFDAKKFAIKVVYGWAVPQGDLLRSGIKSVIRGCATTLLLQLQRHNLDFKQDGTVEVMTEYTGYSDAVMSQPGSDIFWLGEERAKNVNMKKKAVTDAAESLDKVKKEQVEVQKTGTEDAIEAVEGQATEDKESAAVAKEELNEEEAANKIFVYQRLLQALQDSQKIYFFDLDQEQIKIYNEEVAQNVYKTGDKSKSLTSDQVEKLSPDDKAAYEAGVANSTTGPELTNQVAGETPLDSMDAVIENVITGALEDPGKMNKALNEFTKESLSVDPSDASKIRINYIYYGDLLDIVFGVLKDNPDAKQVRALLGPITFTDPGTGNRTIISLADIPIALNKFLEWYNQNVIAEQRQEYLLQDFIKDTIKDLIHAALGEGCFEGAGAPTPQPNVSVTSLAIPGTGPGGKTDRIPKGVGRINIDDIPPGPGAAVSPSAQNQDVSKIHQYVYIYCYTWSMSNLSGDSAADAERGIYHLNIGSDVGIVKSISFNKLDMPKLAASRATSQACDLRHLREVYKAKIEMIGNSLFMPGQMIYINPSVMGIGDPQLRATIANALGLGGYYTVLKVNGSLSRAGFTTSVEAMWESGPKNPGGATMGAAETTSNPTEPAIDTAG